MVKTSHLFTIVIIKLVVIIITKYKQHFIKKLWDFIIKFTNSIKLFLFKNSKHLINFTKEETLLH
jgi:hypothetical protein